MFFENTNLFINNVRKSLVTLWQLIRELVCQITTVFCCIKLTVLTFDLLILGEKSILPFRFRSVGRVIYDAGDAARFFPLLAHEHLKVGCLFLTPLMMTFGRFDA